MLIDYLQHAMRHARYEIMENGRYFGWIEECPGLWGEGGTLEECRDELHSALEDWILIKARHGDKFPLIDGIDINPQPVYAKAD